ncbi:MAG TPA: hypothetical protein VGS00_11485 [Thermoanaerobaculia bacterium]|nr:hypothetical protein [Thermoanaerobaculia bacterium]
MAGTERTGHGAATEPSGVSTGMVLQFAVVLAVVSVVCMGLVGGFFFFLERRTEATEARPMPVETEHPATAEQKLPPEPRLEIDAQAGLAALQAAENERLTSYGWVDRQNVVVRIPIERAMALMVEREKKK